MKKTPKKGFTRSATVSSTTPLRSRDTPISKERKAQFAALDLETLLSEFKSVAATKESDDGEAGDDVAESPVKGGGGDDGAAAAGGGVDDGHSIPDLEVDGAEGRLTALTESDAEPPTLYTHLGEGDKQQVQHINLLVLKQMLESSASGRKLKLGKGKKKKKKGTKVTVFGTDLQSLYVEDIELRRPHMSDVSVPLFLDRACTFITENGLDTEGIFRKPGSASRIRALLQKCEDVSAQIDLAAEKSQVVDVACLLKQFIRDASEPLLTSTYLDAFSATQSIEDPEDQVRALALVVQMLPQAHQNILKRLLQTLSCVADNESVNKMGVPNLAVVFAPSLFFVKGAKGQKMLKEVEAQVVAASCVKMMITHHEVLWTVSPDILAKVRFLTEQSGGGKRGSRAKDVKKLLKKKEASSDSLPVGIKCETDNTEYTTWVADGDILAVVRVTLDDGAVTKKLNVKKDDTVQTVLEGVGCAGSLLEECGGNIGSRRLDPRTKVIPLLHLNPNCQLHVRSNDK